MSENGIKVLEKGLDFAPIHRKINKPELCKDSEEFCKRISFAGTLFPYDRRSVSIVLQPSPFFPNLNLIFHFIIIKNGTTKKSVGKLVKR